MLYQLCVLFLSDDDRTLTTEIAGLFQFLWSFHHPAFEFCSWVGLNILHMVPSNSTIVLAFHTKKKKVHREKPISNRMKMKIIDDDAGSLNTIRGRCQFHSGSSFLWACRLRAWPEYRTAWSRFKEFEPKRRSLRSDQSSEVLCIHCWFYIFLCEHLLSPSWMNGDTLSFGTSIKCVQHIVLANTPFNKSYDCREGHFTEKRVCHVQSALLLFKWW